MDLGISGCTAWWGGCTAVQSGCTASIGKIFRSGHRKNLDMKVVKKIWGKIRGISWMEMVEKLGKR